MHWFEFNDFSIDPYFCRWQYNFFPFITILLQSEKPSLKYVIEGYLCIHSGIRIQSVDNVSIRYWHSWMQRVLLVKYLE